MIWFIIAVSVILLALLFLIWQNIYLQTSYYEIVNDKIKGNGEMKILHISDLQNSKYPLFYSKISKLMANQNPDFIVFTGDIIDRRKYNLDNAKEFIEKIKSIAPIYFVSGNHEAWCGKDNEVYSMLEKQGVAILDDENKSVSNGEIEINLIGIKDVGYLARPSISEEQKKELVAMIKSLKTDDYSVLLTHRPELINEYAAADVDLVLCGHAHGGQFRLPIIGALYAPHQGIFPKYTAGVHIVNNTTEIINRGLGSGKLQFRTFNRPEISVITIKSE